MTFNSEINTRIKAKNINKKTWILIYSFFVVIGIFYRIAPMYTLLEFSLLSLVYNFLKINKFDYNCLKFGFKNFIKCYCVDIEYGLILTLPIAVLISIFLIIYYPVSQEIINFITNWRNIILIILIIAMILGGIWASKYSMMYYVVLENPKIKLKKILRISSKLTKQKVMNVFLYRLYIGKILIVLSLSMRMLLLKKIIIYSPIIDGEILFYIFSLAYSLCLPLFIIKEMELYKILKEEAIEKGVLTEEDFQSQQS